MPVMAVSLAELKRSGIREWIDDALVASPSSTVSEIIGLLNNRASYEAFVWFQNKVGAVTTRDLLKARDIRKTKMRSLVRYVPRLTKSATLGEVARIMSEYRMRALPIVEDGDIIGQINAKPLVDRIGQVKQSADFKMGRLMSEKLISIQRETAITKAGALMIRRRIDHLPIMDNASLYGILTSTHIVNAMLPSVSVEGGARGAESVRRLDYAADRLSERQIFLAKVDANLSDVIREMILRDSTYALVTLLDEPQGIVTYRDIINLAAQTRAAEELPINITGLPEDPFEAEASRDKFASVVRVLRKAFPEIVSADAVIKSHGRGGPKRRYEVRVRLVTPYGITSYSETGWELVNIFDRLSQRMKKALSSRPSRVKPTLRRTEHRE